MASDERSLREADGNFLASYISYHELSVSGSSGSTTDVARYHQRPFIAGAHYLPVP